MPEMILYINRRNRFVEFRLDAEALSWLRDNLIVAFQIEHGTSDEKTPFLLADLQKEGDPLAKLIGDLQQSTMELVQFLQG